MYLNTSHYSTGEIGPVPLGIKLQRLSQSGSNILDSKVPLQLGTIDRPGSLNLPAKGGIQRKSAKEPQMGTGLNIQRVVPYVGEHPCPKIEEGTVVETLTPTQYGNVIQVSVFIAEQHIRLKEQGHVLAKSRKASKLCGLFCHPTHLCGQIGLAADLVLPVGANTLPKQVG